MRTKRVQRIMGAVKTHQKISEGVKERNIEVTQSVLQGGNKTHIKKRIKSLKGKISTSRKRARDLWTR
jgi:hypothetical protein